jgi:AcrR family transcriptional regulator
MIPFVKPMPPIAEKPLRADALRNRERILTSGRELFASRGAEAQMDEIAAHAGVGIGTLYRHFPDKQALLTAMARERFAEFTEIAAEAEQIVDPFESLEAALLTSMTTVEGDTGFQFAMMRSDELEWEGIEAQKDAFAETLTRIIDRAKAAGVVRDDLTFDDFPMLLCGITSTMYFKPGTADWKRHLELVLDGLRVAPK